MVLMKFSKVMTESHTKKKEDNVTENRRITVSTKFLLNQFITK